MLSRKIRYKPYVRSERGGGSKGEGEDWRAVWAASRARIESARRAWFVSQGGGEIQRATAAIKERDSTDD